MEESDKIVKNCNKWAINLFIANFEDFEDICKILDLSYNCKFFARNQHYSTKYNDLEIVCVVLAKGE